MTTTAINTNASSTTLAQAIAGSRSAQCASIMSVVTTLKGDTRLAPGEKRGGLRSPSVTTRCATPSWPVAPTPA